MRQLILGMGVLLCACDTPVWPKRGLQSEQSLCDLVKINEQFVLVTPKAILKPVKIQVSAWPRQDFWATPVEWTVSGTLAKAPLPGQQLGSVSSALVTYFIGPFSDLQSPRIIGFTEIDQLVFSNLGDESTFVETTEGWRRKGAPWSFATETFSSPTDVASTLNSLIGSAECARVDWVAISRAANQGLPTAHSTPSSGIPTDAGP